MKKLNYKIIYGYDYDRFYKRFIFGIFTISIQILIIHFTIALTHYKTMNSLICANPFEINKWEQLSSVTNKLYEAKIGELEAKIITGEEEAKWWRQSYNYIKKQNEEQIIEDIIN